jgi:protein-tyrosine-phosphatase
VAEAKAGAISGAGVLKRMLRSLLPRRILREREVLHHLGKPAADHYLGLRMMDAVGLRSANRRTIPSECRNVVFVCFGNIMRSPMAELLLKRALAEHGAQGIVVSSAGIHASPGKEAHPWALAAARDFGLSLDRHRSKLLTAEMMEKADAVFAMDFQNKAELLALYPDRREKIFMLSAYAEGRGKYREIGDPFHGDLEVTRRCYAVIQTCIRNLANSMAGQAESASFHSAGQC